MLPFTGESSLASVHVQEEDKLIVSMISPQIQNGHKLDLYHIL